ncbi:ribonuclease H-like domain-containing protein [Echria macrotheca]|uniref:Ribonuclease H-like domain-containing protein n=1 Tax=Echria macrotheca TaxID=438768 RepID=A0AAJ0F9F1_9PEZI|nr:ribonuclease H-like domain-containing protein [Echria macrotheca]
MEQSQDFTALKDSVQTALVATTRSVNDLTNEDLQFQRTVSPAVASDLDEKSARLLGLANGLLKAAGQFTGQRVSALEDVDDVDFQWQGMMDVVDSLLYKIDTCLDDYTGLIKRKEAPTSELGRDPKRPKGALERSMKTANILKPQDKFEKKIDNFDSGPWKPLLTTKPHAQRSLDDSLVVFTDQEGKNQFKHPYETEILDLKFPQQVYEKATPQKYLPLDSATATWVDTWEGVLEMLDELKKATEIAIDLEHHDFRTYAGLLSLMQISTRDKDWIVDTLVPWRHKLEVLNEVFADPGIVKVLHGAYMDIIWMQRDLGLYIVGLFDTFHASDVLDYPSKGLSYLLKKFADFDADKKYQLADWRIRPLPEEMFYYAQCDTHFLLYVYDMLRNELVEASDRDDPEKDLIGKVLQKSQETALQRYENIIYDAATGLGVRGWSNQLLKTSAIYNSEQFAVYKALHQWRDHLARLKDESTNYIMGPRAFQQIVQVLPSDRKALWSCLGPNAMHLKSHIDGLFDVIQKAKAEGANGPSMLEYFRQGLVEAVQKPLKATTSTSIETEKLPSIEKLTLKRSQLFGDVPLSSRWDGTKKAPANDIIVYTYPKPVWGPVDAAPEKEEEADKTEAGATHQPVTDVAADQEFTLKGGRRRKSRDIASSPVGRGTQVEADSEMSVDDAAEKTDSRPSESSATTEASDSDYVTPDEKKRLERKAEKLAAAEAKKKARKARKKRKRAAMKEKADKEAGGSQEEEQPFDYSKAESVLHGSKTNGSGPAKGKGAKPFNPYGDKSGDAPKGARKLGLVKSGKTATFKK